MSALPVFPAVRHVRLSAAHAGMLFGARKPNGDAGEAPGLTALYRMQNGLDASDGVVNVGAGEGARKLELVRVLLPYVQRSVVHLCVADAEALGLSSLGTSIDRSPGCTLSGPHGVVVLAEGVVAAERVVVTAPLGKARVDVQLEGERPRFVRSLPVEEGSPACVVVADASGELRPGVLATLL